MSAVVLAVSAACGAAACLGTRILIPVLRRRAWLDRPNERSLHATPTARGGGIAAVAVVLAAWAVLGPPQILVACAAALLLAAISWIDDLRGVSAALRLPAHAAAVCAGLLALPAEPVFQDWLPVTLDRAVAALFWLWFTNLFNFMDGMDGLAGSEAAAVAFGLALLAGPVEAPLAAAVFGAAVGFLAWNWAPARIFLGDVGSVPLGYLLGFLLLAAAARGHWAGALILPSYFLADATITLLRRLFRGAQVWQAHREHFYQRAVQRGLGHAAVAWRIAAANALLISCAYAAEHGAAAVALAAAAVIVGLLLIELGGYIPRQTRQARTGR